MPLLMMTVQDAERTWVNLYNRLRHWSRGHLFVCRPCGHIDFSQPIYRYSYTYI